MNKNELTNKQIINFLLNFFPLSLAEEWDESGLKKFNKIGLANTKTLICLDVTQEVVNLAIKQKVNLIISHHPIFTKLKEIKPNQIDLKNLNLLKKNKICLLSMHTNVDNSKIGLNYYLAKFLNLGKFKQIKTHEGNYFEIKLNKAQKCNDLINIINKKFKTIKSSYFPSNDLIKRILICSGSGYSVLKNTKTLSNNDLLITGDIKWHDWVYISQSKYHVLDVGHDLEKYFINLMTETLIKKFKNIKIIQVFPNINLITLNNKI